MNIMFVVLIKMYIMITNVLIVVLLEIKISVMIMNVIFVI